MEYESKVQTTVVLELEGRLCHATSSETVDQIEAHMQAEHFIHVDLDGKEISVQAGSIEYLQKGDQRPENESS